MQTGEVLLGSGEAGESSASVRERVLNARAAQTERGSLNAALSGNLLHQSCQLDAGSEKLLSAAMERLGLSARALHRILRVARTLADLDGEPDIARNHLMEALGYRQLDRQQNQGPVVSA